MQGAAPPPQGPPGPPPQQGGMPFNMNPVTNPTHPSHVHAARHLGAAIGHSLTDNHEGAKAHLHAMLDKLFESVHTPADGSAASQQAASPQPAKPKKPAKKSKPTRKKK
jgi:hypothetical protein